MKGRIRENKRFLIVQLQNDLEAMLYLLTAMGGEGGVF